nr:MAG TPA: late expression factor 10-like protein [Caudoviricetes sp.]
MSNYINNKYIILNIYNPSKKNMMLMYTRFLR